MTSTNAPAPDAVTAALEEANVVVSAALDALLPKPAGPESGQIEAMRHLVLGAGQRWRAFLVLQSGRLFGIDSRPLARVAAAAECVHAFARAEGGVSHLDGALSAAANRDEATIRLAGNAHLAFAFTLLGSGEGIGDPYIRAELMTQLAKRSGPTGLTGGQMLERAFAAMAGGEAPPLPEITRLQRMKTASLTMFCTESGAIMGHASASARHALSAYGQDWGLAFQIACDLGVPVIGGGAVPTVVSALGTERARAQATALTAQALRHLDLFDEKADLLRAAARYLERMAGAAAA